MSPSIRVPVSRPEDVALIGPIAAWLARVLDRSIEVLTIISPEDEPRLEQDRYAGVIADLEAQTGLSVSFRLTTSDDIATAFVELCRNRLTVMLTSASPFDETHFVGSFASALLATSEAPVVLAGPHVPLGVTLDPARIYVGRTREPDDLAATTVAEELAGQLGIPVATITIDPKGVVYEHNYDDEHLDRPDQVHATMRSGPISDHEIADLLAERAVDGLLVLTTRANQNLARICGGSVAMDTIANSTSPVVVLGPSAEASFQLVAAL